MLLKTFLLLGEEGISDVKKSFSFQTRCITKLYERVFDKKYKTADCRQLNFHCGNYSEMKLLGCFDGFCQVLVPYNTQEFLEYPDNKKKIEILELLKNSLDFVIREKNWDPNPFQEAYERVKELNYINEFIWNKPKLSPNKKYKAEVHCNHDLYDFTIKMVIKDRKDKVLLEKKIVSTEPDELIYDRFLGHLMWISDDEIALYEKNSKRYTSVKLREA